MNIKEQVGQPFNPEWLKEDYDNLAQLYMVSDPKSISPEMLQQVIARLKQLQPQPRDEEDESAYAGPSQTGGASSQSAGDCRTRAPATQHQAPTHQKRIAMFQLKPFKELIALSKEKIDEALAPLRASTAKAKATLKQAEIDEKIAVLGQQVQELATSREIDFDKIADKIDEIALLELRKSRFEEITSQLFPAG
jgi:hypothetical protein